jgi:phosphoserine phosphatase RsbU/P
MIDGASRFRVAGDFQSCHKRIFSGSVRPRGKFRGHVRNDFSLRRRREAVGDTTSTFLREQLESRRRRLESALGVSKQEASLMRLLKEVDAALERMDGGTYGICEACHEAIEKDRLIADPLRRYCLDHLTSGQQRALEQDLEMAARIQRQLLPRQNLCHAGWETSYHYQPLGPVSGDYCDLVVHEDGAQGLFFALGDVSGKGVAASMLMAHLHAIFRTLLITGQPLTQLMERAGRIFCESKVSNLFATLVCGRAGANGEIELCNAGHCPALLARHGELSMLESTGVPLGLFCEGQYPAKKLQLSPGDTLFLYTDGVSEARSAGDEEYGEARLVGTLSRGQALPLATLIKSCIEDVAAFRAGTPLADDLTVLVIRRAV